ncbi:MAG: hypothetical protein Q9227_006559 [Pyrenula ochraceoflavens]
MADYLRGASPLSEEAISFSELPSDGEPDWLAELFPGLEPSVPLLDEREVSLAIVNPYAVPGTNEHPRIRSKVAPLVLPNDGAVNGLIKFRLRALDEQRDSERPQARLFLHRRKISDVSTDSNDTSESNPSRAHLSYAPPDFGKDLHLDQTDTKLWRFYIVAFCPGRTLLPETNCWLNSLPAVAQRSGCAKFALLSLAAGYVLDYAPSEKLRARANKHHRKAVALLSIELNKERNYDPGNEEGVLAALALLNQEDMINWETHLGYGSEPKWYLGLKAMKYLLDKSDPGYRYHKPINVQSSFMRYYMGNVQAQNDILCQCASPLDMTDEECPYPWLLEGGHHDNPSSPTIPIAAHAILTRLSTMTQWSNLSTTTPSLDVLLTIHSLDPETGKITTPTANVDFTALSYVLTAQIYLHCRLLRQSRHHPIVQRLLKDLIVCTKVIPLSGHMYTAQVNLVGPVISAFVAM